MGKKELIELTEWRCKQAEKRFRELAELYAADEIEMFRLVDKNYKADRRYYKLLKKYKSLKKENKALYKEIKYDYSHVGISEGVLKREWDTPEEDKAWEGLLDESSGVINSSGNSSIEDAVEKETKSEANNE